jgi:hypothetical protein
MNSCQLTPNETSQEPNNGNNCMRFLISHNRDSKVGRVVTEGSVLVNLNGKEDVPGSK